MTSRLIILFSASASGAKSDAAISDDGNNEDDNWNPIWYMKTSIDDKGWCAEMKIPLSQLRFGKNNEQIWGLQVTRNYLPSAGTFSVAIYSKRISGRNSSIW